MHVVLVTMHARHLLRILPTQIFLYITYFLDIIRPGLRAGLLRHRLAVRFFSLCSRSEFGTADWSRGEIIRCPHTTADDANCSGCRSLLSQNSTMSSPGKFRGSRRSGIWALYGDGATRSM